MVEASVAQWLSHSPCNPGVAGLILGFSSPSDETINRGPQTTFHDKRPKGPSLQA